MSKQKENRVSTKPESSKKKSYSSPKLTVYGTIHKITAKGTRTNDAASRAAT